MNTSVYRFFQVALWAPLALLLSLPLLEHLIRGTQDFESMLLAYGLWFGALAYLIFAMWGAWYIKEKPEPVIARLVWWAPVIFIPFYGIPWVLYGLFHLAMGELSGIGMALQWVALSPYIIVTGYVFSAMTFAIYEMFFKSATGHAAMRVMSSAISHMVGNAELFSARFERVMFVNGEENLASYPRKIFLGSQGLLAYHAILMTADSEFEGFCELVGTMFGQTTIKQDLETIYSCGDGSTLQLAIRQEFNGVIIELITNSKEFLEGLDASFKAPPPPWLAFPQMEPIEATMNKQGGLEYWWDWIWNPFWEHTSAETRANYLHAHKASDEWAEYLAGQATGTD